MKRIPPFAPLPRFDLDEPDDAQPTIVAPHRTAIALAQLDLADPGPTTSERQSGIRALLESTLAKRELEDDDSQHTRKLARIGCAPPTYSLVVPRDEEISIEIEEETDERDDEALDALVAVYESRPTERPPPPRLPPPAPSRRHARAPKTERQNADHPIALIERWAALDIRVRLGALVVWTALASVVTALIAR